MTTKQKEPEWGFDPFVTVVVALLGGFILFYGSCIEQYTRNMTDSYSPVTIYNQAEWYKASPLMPGGSGVTYYYCPIHTPGRDPELLWMQAKTYGWTEVRCPYCMAAVTAGNTSAQSTQTKE